jgi:hypothetical protein
MGMPVALDTMLRSGVPPHMGQFPDPGSPALIGEPLIATATTASIKQ